MLNTPQTKQTVILSEAKDPNRNPSAAAGASAIVPRLSMQPTVIPSGAGRFFLPARAVEESLFGRSLEHPIQNHHQK